MRVASITGKNITEVRAQIAQAFPFADIIELRFDFWDELDLSEIAKLRHEMTLPVIFTLRDPLQGGQRPMQPAERLDFIEKLAALSPEYIDLEYDVDSSYVADLHAKYPVIQLICSYHNFSETPQDLLSLFQRMHNPFFSMYKIATFAKTMCDTLRLMIFLQQQSIQHRMIGMAMGDLGQVSRILAPVIGSLFTYGSLPDAPKAAPGQLTLSELTHLYRIYLLNRQTAIYALLGDPVAHSQGHLFHNAAFAEAKRNAVYVKLHITPEELTEAFTLLRQLPFQGFSVTMPHKETIAPLLDVLESDAKALRIVNTIKKIGSKWHGYNTDGFAGASILEKKFPLQQQPILILGAGGSAKAIAYALIKRGSQVTLCNRTLQRAHVFSKNFGGACIDFDTLFAMKKLSYRAIVNTLPADAFSEQCAAWTMPAATMQNGQVAMDIVYNPPFTPFLQKAQAAGFECVTGDALFTGQAMQQLKIWFED